MSKESKRIPLSIEEIESDEVQAVLHEEFKAMAEHANDVCKRAPTSFGAIGIGVTHEGDVELELKVPRIILGLGRISKNEEGDIVVSTRNNHEEDISSFIALSELVHTNAAIKMPQDVTDLATKMLSEVSRRFIDEYRSENGDSEETEENISLFVHLMRLLAYVKREHFTEETTVTTGQYSEEKAESE
jgi:hypothetical protein